MEEYKEEKLEEREILDISKAISQIKEEMSKVLVGQEEIINGLILALICDGHVLVEGVPGIAKTLVVKALGKVVGCETKRIQFTVDLLPSDILGLTTYDVNRGFEIVKGPIFANFTIADEINRSPPKTQSALLEAMEEKQVTIGRYSFSLPSPFFVMATENPLETSGVYILPEAQIDRFLFKLVMTYPPIDDEEIIMEKNTNLRKFESIDLKPVITPEEILSMQAIAKRIYLSDKIKRYILDIVKMTREKNFDGGEYIEWGASPRATIGLYIASKAKALMNGRTFVIPKDVKEISAMILRHRMILSYRAVSKGISSDELISKILNLARTP